MLQEQPVCVVDDQAAVRRALARVLMSAGHAVAQFASAQALLDFQELDTALCLVLDLAMPGMNGLALQQALVERGYVPPIIFLTGHGDIATGVLAMKRGAVDFLTKPVDDEVLLAAVAVAMERGRAERVRSQEVDAIRARYAGLTPREQDVLHLVVAGHMNKQIAYILGTAEKTIKTHRARVMSKMGSVSLADLVRLAARGALGGPPDRL